MMTPERWRRLEELFHAASARPAEERDHFLDAECAGDAVLREEIASLLHHQGGEALRERVIAAAAAIASPTRANLSGRALGPYVLGPLLGAGGMCDVYRAHDAQLGRDVAVKILPEGFNRDADRLRRFEREARILGALSHPNIAVIHGLQTDEGIRGLVLEFVEGVSLKERIARGALPVAEALSIARQIADALAAAHEKGIVHRDLKPGNVQVTSRGLVKVLDFGLAKVAEPSLRSLQPVLTTADGVVLGTVAYMSPEQARGLTVDKRTDIWAFGCVLYEMLTGVRPFAGDSAADVLGAITSRDPDWTLLPPVVPARVRDLLRRCLIKDPDHRVSDIADARTEIDVTMAGEGGPERLARGASGAELSRLTLAILIVAVVISAALALWSAVSPTDQASQPATRISLPLPVDAAIALGDARGSSVALSPDGRRIVYVAVSGGRTQLYTQLLDATASTPMSGTAGATSPFFSPDGRWVAFHADGKLKKIPVEGGAAITIMDNVSRQSGAAWAENDTVVFVPEFKRELWRVSSSGGSPERLTTLAEGELLHAWPVFLPGGKAVLYTVWNNAGPNSGRIVLQSLERGGRDTLVERASYGRVAVLRDGRAYLVFARTEGLLAAPFDLDERRLTGPEVSVVTGVMTNLSGGAHFSLSPAGVLAYVPGEINELDKTPLWVSRDGAVTELPPIRGLGMDYSLSPDGQRVARPSAEGWARDIWVDDLLGRHESTRLTFDGLRGGPIWTPDGRRVVYSGGEPNANLFWRPVDLSEDEERLTTSANRHIAGSVSPDGTMLAYTEQHPARGFDIWLLPLKGRREPRPFLATPALEGSPQFSRDGRLLAFSSNVSGRPEIYLAPVRDGSSRIPVSNGFGLAPRWSNDGRELFYQNARSDGDIVAVPVDTTDATPKIGTPRVLFPVRYLGTGEVAPDGRFLFLKRTPQESTARAIQVALNWFEVLPALLAQPKDAGAVR